MLIRGGGGGGGALIRGAGGGELIRGGGAEPVRPSPRDISGPLLGCIMERGGVMAWVCEGMRCVTIPFDISRTLLSKAMLVLARNAFAFAGSNRGCTPAT